MELQVSHLLHVDRYFNQYGLQFAGRKRADLFGIAPYGWVVAEAKGRSRTMESDLRAKLILQKRSVLSVCGAAPALAMGCVASFPVRNGGMEIDAFDPDKTEPDALIIPGTTDEFMLAYYLPFLTIIELSDRGPDTAATVTGGFGTFGLRVDMLTSVYRRVQRATQERNTAGLVEDIQRLLDQAPLREVGLLADGTAVGTAWTEAVAVQGWYEEPAL